MEYFKHSKYSDLDIAETLKFYTNRYVCQLLDFVEITEDTVIADIGAGFGWLSMAFACSTVARLVAIDPNGPRLMAGKAIANFLGIGDRIDWRTGSLGDLPLDNNEADVVYCIEVLEHVYKDSGALQDLCRVSKNLLIITTPNLWFPVIAHDTRLPFCHWMPISFRKSYAQLFDRNGRENDNLFWSPMALRRNMQEFKPVSKWLHYSSYEKFKKTFPFYLPYGKFKYYYGLGCAKRIYFGIISRFGMFSHYLTPSLAYVMKKKQK